MASREKIALVRPSANASIEDGSGHDMATLMVASWSRDKRRRGYAAKVSRSPEALRWEEEFGLERGSVDVSDPTIVGRDLALARGCAQGNAKALAVFERELGEVMDRAIKRSPTLGISTDEFRQIIREKLFVATPGSAPKIASYEGRAPLSGWLRVLCTRAVIDLSRRQDDAVPVPSDDLLFERIAAREDPEVASLRARMAHVVPAAFTKALEALQPRQRNLLRQRYLHGVAASTLAEQYGVHRATVFGWIEDARKELMVQVRANVNELAASELDSVMALMGSELDVSIRRLLDSVAEPEEEHADKPLRRR